MEPIQWARLIFFGVVAVLSATVEGADIPVRSGLSIDLQFRYGLAGGLREAKFIAGESVTFGVRVRGLTVSPHGKIDLALHVILRDAQGNLVFNRPLKEIAGVPALGGSTFTQGFSLNTPADFLPGEYQVEIVAEDRLGDAEASAQRLFELLPNTEFGAMNLRLAYDNEGKNPASFAFGAGTSVFIVATINGHTVDDAQMHVICTGTVVDEHGDAVGEPIVVRAEKEVSRYHGSRPFQVTFRLPVTRGGKFRVQLEVHDAVSGEQVEYEIPIEVLDGFGDQPLARSG